MALSSRLAGAGVAPGYKADREGTDLGCKEGRTGADPVCREDGVVPGWRGMGWGDPWVQTDGQGCLGAEG